MPLRGELGTWLIGLAVAVIGTVVTLWVCVFLIDSERQQREIELAGQAERIRAAIIGHFSRYEILLDSGRALFAGSEFVGREEWRAFSKIAQSRSDNVVLVELAWLPRLSPVELENLRAALAAEGIDEFALDPPGPRAEYCPIVYNEPFARHAVSLGHDACARPSTYPAMLRARESGAVTLSEPLSLAAEDGEQPGYVLFAHVDGNGRQQSGWVAGAVPTDSIFDRSLAGTALALNVTDESVSGEPGEIFRSGEPTAGHEQLSQERLINIGGRQLRLDFSLPLAIGPTPWLVLGGGLIITLLLAAFLATLLRTRARALKLSERMTRAFRDSEELLASITNNISDGIYRGTPNRGLVYVNPALAQMFRFDSPRAMIEHAGPILYARPEQREELHQLLIRDGRYHNQEVEYVRPDGSRFIAINNATAVRDDDGRIVHFDGVVSDITERKRAEEEVHRLAHYDALTGLPNRTLLHDRISQSIAHVQRGSARLALLFIDLDRFKTINDSLGHSTGDRLLVAVAERIETMLRDYDTVSRQGGDEFIVVLPDIAQDAIARKAEAILDAISQPFLIDGHELVITPSIGITVYPDDADDPDTLIRNADAAMYHAKELGRSTFQFFTAELNARAYDRLAMETHLRQALARDEFRLAFQPVVRLSDERIVGAEALLRWHNHELGDVSPAEFIPLAEQSGLIVEIGAWVIDRACRQLARWQQQGLEDIAMAVNVSAVQFLRGTLDDDLRRALKRHAVTPGQLQLELTESVIMQDAAATSTILAELKLQGVDLAIDDFGTGYSSLSYLKRFHIDRLKIDQSFVHDITSDSDDAAIIAAVLSMAEDLHISVVAEGVETRDQLDYMKARGCQYAQGFLFSPAISAEEFAALVRGR